MGIGRIFLDFAGWTTASGIPHIGSAQNNWLRAFWSIITLICLAMFIYQTYDLTKRYLKYDVSVQTTLEFAERPFPTVTVCNLNPYKLSKVTAANTPDMSTMLTQYSSAVSTGTTYIDSGSCPWCKFANLSGDFALQAKAQSHLVYLGRYYQDNSLATLNTITYSYDDLIIACTYNGKPCNQLNFTDTIDPLYGRCQIFNFDASFNSTRAGPLYGLRLHINVMQLAEYLPSTLSAGVKVAIHGENDEPYPESFAYDAPVGFTTSFGVKYLVGQKLSSPYGDCLDAKKMDGNYYYNGTYSVEGCFRTCYQDALVKQCTCGDPQYKKDASQTYCKYDSISDRSCVSNFTLNFDQIDNCPQCVQPCNEISYGVTVSSALFPSEAYNPSDCQAKSGTTDKELCRQWYGNNTLKVEVYYERMNYQQISESPDYELILYFNDVAGVLGLWLGFSVMTFVEFFSLAAILILYCATHARERAAAVAPINDGDPEHDPNHEHNPEHQNPENNPENNPDQQQPADENHPEQHNEDDQRPATAKSAKSVKMH